MTVEIYQKLYLMYRKVFASYLEKRTLRKKHQKNTFLKIIQNSCIDNGNNIIPTLIHEIFQNN